jgi:hypothetical protein
MVESAPPCQSVVRLFPVVVCARVFSDIFPGSKILVGNSPAGSPIEVNPFQVKWLLKGCPVGSYVDDCSEPHESLP